MRGKSTGKKRKSPRNRKDFLLLKIVRKSRCFRVDLERTFELFGEVAESGRMYRTRKLMYSGFFRKKVNEFNEYWIDKISVEISVKN